MAGDKHLTEEWDAAAAALPAGWLLALEWDEDGHHAIATHRVPWTPGAPASEAIIETADDPAVALRALAAKLRDRPARLEAGDVVETDVGTLVVPPGMGGHYRTRE